MSRFSERMGFKAPRSAVQLESMDTDLRNGLWNVLSCEVLPEVEPVRLPLRPQARVFCLRLQRDHFKGQVDQLPDYWPTAYGHIKDYFFQCKWFEVYDFVEFVAHAYPDVSGTLIPKFTASCNDVLKRELSAYRFVGTRMAPITSESEMGEIQEALQLPVALHTVTQHIERALALLADKKSPDYRNSIKESISAVEALCRLITGRSKATLGKALKKIDDTVSLHGALQEAFRCLYGYTSDEQGIRHSLMDESTLDIEDARFMLISCSAFVNHLVEKASKAGIEF
jgi:hypothetical protein